MTPIDLRIATPDEAELVAELWTRASNWLGTFGTDQWQYPVRKDNIAKTIAAKELWIGSRSDLDYVATVTVSRTASAVFWPDSDAPNDALYVSRMVVDRPYANEDIGTAILDWVSRMATATHRNWVRLDAWRTNNGLLRYYLARGFTLVRTVDTPSYPAACFQRAATIQLGRGPVIRSIPEF